MYGWDLCPGTATVTEKPYKEPLKLANESMVTHKPGQYATCGEPIAERNNGLSLNEVGLDGLEVTCSPRDPRFAGSNPAQVDGFFQNVKILSTSSPGVPSLKK